MIEQEMNKIVIHRPTHVIFRPRNTIPTLNPILILNIPLILRLEWSSWIFYIFTNNKTDTRLVRLKSYFFLSLCRNPPCTP